MAVVYIFLGALLTVATALSLGLLLLRRITRPLSLLEHYVFAYVTGSALLSLLVFALAALHVVYKGTLLGVAALAIGSVAYLRAWRRPHEQLTPIPTVVRRVFLLVFCVFGYLYLVNAAAPEYSPDGSTYHLGIVGRYYRERGLVPIPTTMYASLTQGVEMLFLFAYAFGRHSAAALVHLSFLFTLPLAILAWSQRAGRVHAGLLAAILVYASPVFGVTGTSAYTDVALATVLFVLYCAIRLDLWLITGMLAGFAFDIKYTAFLAIPFALVHVRGKRAAIALLGAATLSIAPWLARNLAYTGNPVAPFFTRAFPNPLYFPDMEEDYTAGMRSYEGVSPASIPIELTVRGVRLGGFLGPLFLLTPLALLGWRDRNVRGMLAAGVLFALPYPLNIGTRFLMPAAPFFACALALFIASWPAVALALSVLHAVLSWPSFTTLYCHHDAMRLAKKIPVKAALRIVPEGTFLYEKSRAYLGARMIDEHVPPGAKVFSFGNSAADAYTGREIAVSFQSAIGRRVKDLLWTPLVDEMHTLRTQEFRFPPQPVHTLTLTQTAAHPLDVWTVSEIRLLDNNHEPHRDPSWRVFAPANPFEIDRAFDGNLITRWSSHRHLEPGTSIRIEFTSPIPIDAIVLQSTRDQYQVRLKIEVNGREVPLARETEGPSIENPRREATRQMSREGFSYLLVDERDFGASDFRDRSVEWGLRLLETKGGLFLYKVE